MAETKHLSTFRSASGHPDENLLAAFAEGSLNVREREGVLEHLSACARCRDVVFLAQQAFPETGSEAPFLHPSLHRERRFRWAMAGAGVLAAMLVAVPMAVYRHRGHVSGRAALSASVMQGDASKSATPTAPPELSRTIEAEQRQPGLYHAQTRPSGKAGRGGIAGSVKDRAGAVIPGASVSARALSSGNTHTATADKNGQFDLASLPSGEYQVDVQAPGFRQFSQAIKIQPSERAKLEAKLDVGSASETVAVSAGSVAGPIPTTQRALGVIGGIDAGHDKSALAVKGRNPAPMAAPAVPQQQVTASGAQPVLQTAQTSDPGLVITTTFRLKDGIVERCIGADCVARPLPSEAKAVSAAGSGQIVMALDSDGNLFLSTDQGEHWKQAKMRWESKAVSVGLLSQRDKAANFVGPRDSSLAPSMAGAVADRKAPAPVVPPIFELKNDKGKVWVSSDGGNTWVAK